MSFNFPSTPTSGQTYEPVGGPVFVWDGTAWKSQTQGVPVTVYVGDSPPVSPALGQLWWDSDSGNLFIWYADGDSAQWVQVSGMPKTEPPTALARNRVVNGAMQISQETAAAVVTGGYPVDQFQLVSPLATVGASRQPATAQFTSTLATSIVTGKPALATGDYWQIIQPIEGTRIADFRWGNANAKPVVVCFWAYSNQAGTYTFLIKNHIPDRIFAAPFTLAATTWTEIVIAVPAETTGTWLADTSLAMRMVWGLAAGTSQGQCVAGWSSTNGVQMIGHTNLAQASGTSFYLANVGLYLDPDNTGVAPKWQMPDEAEELIACQRYWQKGQLQFSGEVTNASGYRSPLTALVPNTRVQAALTLLDGGVSLGFPATVGTPAFLGGQFFYEFRNASSTNTNGLFRSSFTANARM